MCFGGHLDARRPSLQLVIWLDSVLLWTSAVWQLIGKRGSPQLLMGAPTINSNYTVYWGTEKRNTRWKTAEVRMPKCKQICGICGVGWGRLSNTICGGAYDLGSDCSPKKKEAQSSSGLNRVEVYFSRMRVQRKTVQSAKGGCVLQRSQRPRIFLAFALQSLGYGPYFMIWDGGWTSHYHILVVGSRTEDGPKKGHHMPGSFFFFF